MILAPVSFGDGVAGSWFPFTDPCLLAPEYNLISNYLAGLAPLR